MGNDISLIALLAFSTLLPFIIASGTCFVKFSIVFVMVRNARLQQIPSNMTLNGVALLLSMFVMWPIMHDAYVYFEDEDVTFNDISSLSKHVDEGLDGYRDYLIKYSDRELVQFFENAQLKRQYGEETETVKRDKDEIEKPSIFALLPAYALSEIKARLKLVFISICPLSSSTGGIQRATGAGDDDDESGDDIYTY